MTSAAYPFASSRGPPSPYLVGMQLPSTSSAFASISTSLSAQAHPGTFEPRTKVQVGQKKVIVERYLSEGGFAHVYVVQVPNKQLQPHGTATYETAVLKRVAVPDRENLANMRTEVDTMKKLNGRKHIVEYKDSHASQLQGGGYEVFLLMEFCSGGGLIDFMNTRLQNRLTEPEILEIISDVSEGVADMHYLKPPLVHRDLKVENVLISTSAGRKVYKLCDFGSASVPIPAANTAAEARLLEDDIQKHTTLQYRSPEMIDVYRHQPIDEKSDIWALGVLLYKLCYYKTPFENENGQMAAMAALNASVNYPSQPVFSDGLKRLIGSMLKENPQQRPNIYQVIEAVCSMTGTPIPVKDIYRKNQTISDPRRYETPHVEPALVIGLSKVVTQETKPIQLPEIARMRRGRPNQASALPPTMRDYATDPFTALDSQDYKAQVQAQSQAIEQISQKYPSLDEFSLLHDQRANLKFAPKNKDDSLRQRVTAALADDAFSNSELGLTTPSVPAPIPAPLSDAKSNSVSLLKPTGIQTLPIPSSPVLETTDPSARPLWRASSRSPFNLTGGISHIRFDSPDGMEAPNRSERNSSPPVKVPSPKSEVSSRRHFFERNRSKPQHSVSLPKSTSSRPSLEGQRPTLDPGEKAEKSRSVSARRPKSSHVDDLDSHDFPNTGPFDQKRPSSSHTTANFEGSNITSSLDFLRSIESPDDNSSKKLNIHRRSSSGHKSKIKRASIPSISLSSAKSLIVNKFEAFRRFENHDRFLETEHLQAPLSPIAVSSGIVDTDDDNDDKHVALNTGAASDVLSEDEMSLSPEIRRELERQRLEQEERRVAAAKAEYRTKMDGVPSGKITMNKASLIQNRVKNLLNASEASANAMRTAEGYGKFTETLSSSASPSTSIHPIASVPKSAVVFSRKSGIASPAKPTVDQNSHVSVTSTTQSIPLDQAHQKLLGPISVAPVVQKTGPKIVPKPMLLRTTTSPTFPPLSISTNSKPVTPPLPSAGHEPIATGATTGAQRDADGKKDSAWAKDFAKRFPSLNGIAVGMVEQEIETINPARHV